MPPSWSRTPTAASRTQVAGLFAQRLAGHGYIALSLMDLMAFDAENYAPLIDQPLLMMVGDVSDTRYMTEGIFERVASADKTLRLIPGASHIEAYWKPKYVDMEEAELVVFLNRTLV